MFKKIKTTRYFREAVLIKRPNFQSMEDEIIEMISHPTKIEKQSDGRTKIFCRDEKAQRWVRIILDTDGSIHNIFYDRDFKL